MRRGLYTPNVIYSSLLSQLDWLEHGFGTRAGPLSQQGMATLRQIHSARVLVADRPGLAGEGDALVTKRAGVALSVRTADCYPILLVDVEARVVAAVHAGWRGTSAGVVVEALRRMNSAPERVWVAIGPGIGACCYEVGAEVAQLFGDPHAKRVDLAEANRRQLRAAGVPDRNIDLLRHCTRCDAERFHSYRRDQDRAGRLISWIAATENDAQKPSAPVDPAQCT
ncbi:MAG TPA: peptidoglycan editing factor PgeF [Bryobacteraceae bacterium]|nr:peptidoglycan editing factor PgeF [Bryobacteraceae bacterium]